MSIARQKADRMRVPSYSLITNKRALATSYNFSTRRNNLQQSIYLSHLLNNKNGQLTSLLPKSLENNKWLMDKKFFQPFYYVANVHLFLKLKNSLWKLHRVVNHSQLPAK